MFSFSLFSSPVSKPCDYNAIHDLCKVQGEDIEKMVVFQFMGHYSKVHFCHCRRHIQLKKQTRAVYIENQSLLVASQIHYLKEGI